MSTMTALVPTRSKDRRPARSRRPRRSGPATRARTEPEPRIDVDALRDRWSAAFDSAQSALQSARWYLTPAELHAHSQHLAAERAETTALLQALARDTRGTALYLHLELPPWQARRLLGLPAGIDAVVFNLDGVLIGSAALHAAAWSETFEELISRRIERTGGDFAPFNPRTDYPAHMHGRPRLEGVREFLESRGMRLPEGSSGDPPGAETVHGLANRKNEALLRLIDQRGVSAFEGSRRYLELAHDAGIRRAVVSASANTDTLLERAGLAGLVEARVDGNAIVAEHLPARPAPDILLAAARRLGVEPERTAVFETSPAGVAAARAGGFGLAVGVDHAGDAKTLREQGAELVVSGLGELLDHSRAA
jgi:HAD superfamily hydrolase (TIGR01509 family)